MSINQFDNYPLSWRPNRDALVRPIYKSLMTQLEEDILSGKLQKNTRLPSQRELADFLDINFTTVGQAYQYGIKKGLLYSNIGSGTYISQNAFSSITISNDQVHAHLFNFGLVSSFEECNTLVAPHLRAVSSQPNVTGLLTYKEPLGSLQQLETATKWLRTQGVTTTPDNIAVVSGVQNGLANILATLFSPGDRIAIDRYTYSNFIELATMLHVEVVPIDYDEEGMLPDFLITECKKKKINGVFLMPSCNNPVGFQMSLARRLELVDVIKKEKLWIIEDDIHSFLTTFFQATIIPPFQALLPEQTLYLAGMTKFICSGLRVAYLVFPTQLQATIKHGIFNINVKTSGFDAEVVTQILASPTADDIVTEKFRLTEQANQLFDETFQLPRPSNPYPYYRNIPVKATIEQHVIEQDFVQHGIRIYHSNRFTTQKQPDPFIRVALSSNHLDVLASGLARIKTIIGPYQ